MLRVQVEIDTKSFWKAFSDELRIKILTRWGMIYRAWAITEYAKNVQGGGEWPFLVESTIKKKEKRGLSNPEAILIGSSHTLINALQPIFANAPGAFQEFGRPLNVTLGYGGDAGHPDETHGVFRTVEQVALFHQFGMGHNPIREIIKIPGQDVLDVMGTDAANQIAKEIDKKKE